MCLAMPGKIIEVSGKRVSVDFLGQTKEADASLVEVAAGDYVMVNAGFVTQKVDEEEALKSIAAWKKLKKP